MTRSFGPTVRSASPASCLGGAGAELVAGHLHNAVDQRHGEGDADVDWRGAGCDGHPSVVTSAAMGARLAEMLQTQSGW